MAPWGQRWCIQWWNTPEQTVQLATTVGRECLTTGHKAASSKKKQQKNKKTSRSQELADESEKKKLVDIEKALRHPAELSK